MSFQEKLENFPFSIRQVNENFCIPASVEAVTKYFKRDSNVNQEYIWNAFVKYCAAKNRNPTNINLAWMKELIDVDPAFRWAESRDGGAKDFHTLFEYSKKGIDDRFPHIISVPIGNGRYHMLTIVGYDKTNFYVHDPDPHAVPNPHTISINQLQSILSDKGTDYLVLYPK